MTDTRTPLQVYADAELLPAALDDWTPRSEADVTATPLAVPASEQGARQCHPRFSWMASVDGRPDQAEHAVSARTGSA